MVCGSNLEHMAPSGIQTTGYCMFFRYTTLVFAIRDHCWDPGSQIWTLTGPGTFFRQTEDPTKQDVVEEKVSSVRGK